jgi:hypothetical protein
VDPGQRSEFWHEGQRYELREWNDAPTAEELGGGMSLLGAAQARWVLDGAASFGLPRWSPAADDTFARNHELERILDEVRSGHKLLVTRDVQPPIDAIASWEDQVVDLSDLAPAPPPEDTWVEFVFEYPDGTKVDGLEYVLVDPAASEEAGKLGKNGTITKRGIAPGEYTVVLKEVERAAWVKPRAAATDELQVVARTSGYPDGTPVTIKLYRERIESGGDELATVEAQIQDDVVEAVLTYDPATDPNAEPGESIVGLIAEVSVDGGKSWAKTPTALALQLPTLRSARWVQPRVDAGATVELVVEAVGHAAGTMVALELWRLDWVGGDSKVCDIGPVEIVGTRAVADAKIDDPGEYYVVATVDATKASARSDLLWCAWVESAEADAA